MVTYFWICEVLHLPLRVNCDCDKELQELKVFMVCAAFFQTVCQINELTSMRVSVCVNAFAILKLLCICTPLGYMTFCFFRKQTVKYKLFSREITLCRHLYSLQKSLYINILISYRNHLTIIFITFVLFSFES